MEKSEVVRYTTMIMLMNDKETRSFLFMMRRLSRSYVQDLAAGLKVTSTSRSVYRLINSLVAYFSDARLAEVVPEVVPEVDLEPEEEPTFECVGCGGLTEASGLRWKKLGEGKPVTITIDHSGKPASLAWLTDEVIVKEWFDPWSDRNPVVQFKLLKSGKGDCHVKWEPVDGSGNTLAYVWQPAGNAEYMEQAGDLGGDMIIDSSERSYPEALVHEAGKHEVGHVLGIGHLNATKDVMYPTAKGENKPLSINDKREEDQRYPFND